MMNRIIKLETNFDSIQVKVDHDLPKSAAKVATKYAGKTEKKLVELLKE